MDKSYLGDSVYAQIENGMILLTTENGFGASNKIYMEPEVLEALDKYRKLIEEKYQPEKENDNQA